MEKLVLKAEKRGLVGRKVKALRRGGILPANVYGKKIDSYAVQVNLNEFLKVYQKAGETGLIELQVNGDKVPTLIHNLQLDPISDLPLHGDFLQVNLKEKVVAQVPVELMGTSPAEKQGVGTVVQYIDEIEVEALPTDLPDKFEVDATTLEGVDAMVQVKDLKIADKDKIEIKEDPEAILVKVEPLREEEVAPPPAPSAEGEIVAEVPPKEDEEPVAPESKEENLAEGQG